MAISDLSVGRDDGDRVDRILAIARHVLSAPGLDVEDPLADHGGTSLSVVRIVAEASRALHVDIDPRDLDGPATVGALARAARGPAATPP